MKTTTFLMLTLLAGILACTEEESFKKTLPIQVDAHSHHGQSNAHNRNYSTHLKGGLENPAVDTKAQGQAILHLSKDGETLHYKLNIANIENVFAAHLHMSDGPDFNGPIVVGLYTAGLIAGRFNGTLAEGDITSADLEGPLTDMTLDDLIDAMNNGNIYVNVHTTDNPGGEVRGNI